MSGNHNGSRNQAATRQARQSDVNLQVYDVNRRIGDHIPQQDHFEIESNARGLHQSAGDINSQVYEENRRIRDHILQQQGSGSENNTARTSTNIPSEGDDY
ncbi:hypothetical protein OS493_015824 [Desmophyllum pertusum]|uniref:Uncharacterized protein n=1 Tax=Desmophyllum pertusum TaxID=174260 RepID=A0A9W9YE85_9CNID|nr:hypothetical protein OS493_015824 [Desmophyllum pertusum]